MCWTPRPCLLLPGDQPVKGPSKGGAFQDMEQLTPGRSRASLSLWAVVQAGGSTQGGEPSMEQELDIQMVIFKCFIFGTVKTSFTPT